ncbi:putative necrosis-inducing factor-domain-containing protein [Daldinia caldariorum]|uniref:putative necrosis-inducing factor-domain-containing protein n=1 Tax=Daldinia caldariorum TaxID=326644 RepID=UPI0020083236|nr:putative necrosis-inducing factor-domain-containing protein [Daldinia caldariorum]KAI1472602.1 putative necrosis-inducing factor-domain-containing protein [Daldinia caldariorum]
MSSTYYPVKMFSRTMLLSVFTALVAGVPSPLIQRQDACAGDKSIVGYCKTLSYTDRTGASSTSAPSSSDCQQTCRGVLTDAGYWGVDFHNRPAGYRDNLYLGPCKFGVSRETDEDTSQFSFSMHNQDIVDVIDEVIKRYAGKHNGKVRADGKMECSGHVVRWYVG